MSTLPIVVYGNGDVFREYFNAIAASFGTNNFSTLISLAILLAGVTVLYSYIMQRDLMIMVKWFGLFYLSVYILFMPKATVQIIDRVNQGKVYSIDNVPLGLAVIGSYTSAIGDALTELTEMNFTLPDDLRYAQTGMVFASRMVSAASQFEITDAQFDENIQEFTHQCIFYDILLNKYTVNDLMESRNVWSFVTSNASPARAFVYNGVVTTCRDGAQGLTADWNNAVNSAISQYAARLFPETTDSTQQKQLLLKYLPISYGYLTNLSDTANNIMQQNLMSNAIQRGIVRMSATLNASAALESYSYARAQEQKRLTNQTLGDMAAYWLPLMKNAFEAIMYGSFIFIVLLSVFPFGGTVIKNYIFTLLWIQLWAPLYAVINLMVSYYAQLDSSAATNGALSLKAMSGLLQINSDISGLAGYLTLSVPFISAGLVKGMAGTFTQIAQYIGGVTQSAGGTAATEAVTGNLGFGNTNFGNHNAFNTSANHFDTSGRFTSGMFTGQLTGGSTLSMMPDGSLVMNTQNAISNLGTSLNLADTIRASATRQYDHAYTAASNEAHAYSNLMSSALKEMSDLSNHLGNSTSQGEGWNYSKNAAATDALSNMHRLTERFAKDHNISFSESQRVLSAAYADLRAGVSVGTPAFLGVGVSGGASSGAKWESDHSDGKDTRETYAAARDYVTDSGYSHAVDTVERAVHDHSFRANSENGQRLLNNMSASFDKAESTRFEMTKNFQEAQSYRTIATQAQENSVSINTNANQAFIEWFSNQPGTNGSGRLGMQGAESIIRNEPELARTYAERFSEQYTSSMVHGGVASNPQGIKSSYENSLRSSPQEHSIRSHYEENNQSINSKAKQEGLNANSSINQSAKSQVDGFISDNKKFIANNSGIDVRGQSIGNDVNTADKI